MTEINNHISKIIYNKYKIENILGSGKFGTVYKGVHLKLNKELAIKREYNNVFIKILKHETTIINYLYIHGCRCIPLVYWFGIFDNSTYLVMTYYPCSLYDYIKKIKLQETLLGSNFLQKEIYSIMIQLIYIMESIHKNFVIHRDIKPQNFMMNENNEIFLIDFGLSTIYIDDENKHIKKEISREFIVGTPNYISWNIHDGITPSRRDDLISVGYIFLLLLCSSLPWEKNIIQNETISSSNIKPLKKANEIHCSQDTILSINHIMYDKNVYLKKEKMLENIIIKSSSSSSPCFIKYMNYCYNLEFDSDPKYYYLRHLFY